MGLLSSPSIADEMVTAHVDFCDDTKTHIQLEARQNLTNLIDQNLGGIALLDCSLQDPLSSLSQSVVDLLADQNIAVTTMRVSDSGQGVIKVAVSTTSDGSETTSTLLPILLAERSDADLDKIIGTISISGEATENETLKVQFPINMNALKLIKGRLQLNWLRDGQPINGATRSRYRLSSDDVGQQLSVQIAVVDGDQNILVQEQSRKTSLVAMANYPPEIQNLTVEGDATLGAELVASFDVFDKNPEDTNTEVEIIWLRDNLAIPGANETRYTLTEDDLGRIIRVMVTPKSATSDGQRAKEGDVAMLALARPVERALVVLAPKPEEIIAADTENTDAENLKSSQDAPQDIAEDAAIDLVEDVVMAPPPRPIVIQTETEGEEDAPQIVVKPALTSIPKLPKAEVLQPEEKLVALAEGLSMIEGDVTTLKSINYNETGLIKRSELDGVIRKYRGQDFDIELIQNILADLNSLYEDKGYELSRALLPQQVIRDGVLKIQLVDAKVGAIIVEDAKRIGEDYIRDRIGFVKGESISLAELETRIRLFNANNKTKLTTELAPGENFGETDIFVKVTEPDFIELPTISVNNHGSELSDWKQNSFTTVFNNLMNIDDEFSVSVSDGKGTRSRAFGLKFPLGIDGTNISLNRSEATTKVKDGPDTTVGFRGNSHSTSASISTPIMFNDEYSVYLSAALAEGYGDLVQPGDGALLSKSTTRKFVVSTPASWSNGLTTLSFSPSVSIINTETVVPPAENWMSKIEADFALSQFINPSLTFNGRGKILYTDSEDMINLPSEILSVGGSSSVRGYQPGEDSGYQGYFLSAELRSEVATWEGVELPSYIPSIQPNIFFDHMLAQSEYRKRSRGDFWTSVGVGLTIPSLFNTFTFDAYWAKPLDGSIHQAEKDAYNENVIKFSLSAKINIDAF